MFTLNEDICQYSTRFLLYRTGNGPAVLLIMERPTDARYLLRLERVAATTKFHIMTITPTYLSEGRAGGLAP